MLSIDYETRILRIVKTYIESQNLYFTRMLYPQLYSILKTLNEIDTSLPIPSLVIERKLKMWRQRHGQSHDPMRGSRKFCQRGSNFDVFWAFF